MNQPDDPGVNPFDWRDSEPMSWTKGLIYGAIVATIIALFSIAFTREGRGQHAHNPNDPGHFYDYECCALNDCGPVPAENVAETPNGYVVRVKPGTHPMWKASETETLVLTFSYRTSKVKPSRDGNWHVCFNAKLEPLCLYVTGGGV